MQINQRNVNTQYENKETSLQTKRNKTHAIEIVKNILLQKIK